MLGKKKQKPRRPTGNLVHRRDEPSALLTQDKPPASENLEEEDVAAIE